LSPKGAVRALEVAASTLHFGQLLVPGLIGIDLILQMALLLRLLPSCWTMT
jgi:hypothetical protein